MAGVQDERHALQEYLLRRVPDEHPRAERASLGIGNESGDRDALPCAELTEGRTEESWNMKSVVHICSVLHAHWCFCNVYLGVPNWRDSNGDVRTE